MELREFGKRSGLKVAPVSIGAMRLPGDGVDAVGLLRKAMDAGMCYIDTSRGYGESEFVVGKALEGVLLEFRPFVFANATKIDFDMEAHVSLFEDGLLKYRKGERIITLPQISLQRTKGKLQLEGVKNFFITGFKSPFRAEGRAFPGLTERGKNLGILFRLRIKR